jgi:hypothetical protein
VSLLPLFEWMDSLPYFEETWGTYLGPGLNIIHLLAMVVFAGAVLIVDLRLMRVVLTRYPVGQLAGDARPWLIGGLAGLVLTGIPAVMATALTQYYNEIFWFKMYVLVAGVIFTFVVRQRVIRAEASVGPIVSRLTGIVSIALWGTVAASARLIMLLA